MLQRRSFPPGSDSATGLGNPCKTNTNNKHSTRCDTARVLLVSEIFNDTLMCQSKVSSEGDINIPTHTDGGDLISNKTSQMSWIKEEKKVLDNHL